MASYVVLERRPVTGSRPETVLVRDEFSFPALLFPFVWLLWHRLWFAALLLLLVSVAIGVAGEYLVPGVAVTFAGLAVSFFVALEGPAWRVARHRRDGFAEIGTVIACNLDDADIRWFTGRGERRAETAPVPPPLPDSFGRGPREPEGDMLFGFAGEAGR